jgi:SOS-response transcriptional repressor LexA
MKKILTKRQVEVLNRIKQYHLEHNEYPSLRTLGKIIDVSSANGVKRHIDALITKGYCKDRDGKYVLAEEDKTYIDIKILGYANAGLPLALADEEEMGSIAIRKNKKIQKGEVFAVIVEGDSMNRQKINGKYLRDNTYALVQRGQDYNNGDCVLAVIDNAATIKNITTKDGYTVLYPNSDNKKHREIYLDKDTEVYINGKVIDILPKFIN